MGIWDTYRDRTFEEYTTIIIEYLEKSEKGREREESQWFGEERTWEKREIKV